jgi:hypothetical protein
MAEYKMSSRDGVTYCVACHTEPAIYYSPGCAADAYYCSPRCQHYDHALGRRRPPPHNYEPRNPPSPGEDDGTIKYPEEKNEEEMDIHKLIVYGNIWPTIDWALEHGKKILREHLNQHIQHAEQDLMKSGVPPRHIVYICRDRLVKYGHIFMTLRELWDFLDADCKDRGAVALGYNVMFDSPGYGTFYATAVDIRDVALLKKLLPNAT